MATVTNKRKAFVVEGNVKVLRKIVNGKKGMWYVMGICSRKFYDLNVLKKQNQNY
jgi:hypothetical protein